MNLSNLKKLHLSMKKIDLLVDVFDFSYDNVDCSVLFNPDYDTCLSLTFFKKKSNQTLKLPVKPGYDLTIQSENFYAFCKLFELKRQKGAFSIKEFFCYLNSKIPTNPVPNTSSQRE